MQITLITQEHKNESNQLTEEGVKILRKNIEEYLKKYIRVDYPKMGALMGVGGDTVKRHMKELISEWYEKEEDNIQSEIRYHESILEDAIEHPEKYELKSDKEIYNFKAEILRTISSIKNTQKRAGDEGAQLPQDVVEFFIRGRFKNNKPLKKITQDIIEADKELHDIATTNQSGEST